MFLTNKENYQFQVGCVSYFNLKQNKALKYQADKCLSSQFGYKNSTQMRKTPKQYNIHVISLIMFYDNIQLLIFKVLGVVVY